MLTLCKVSLLFSALYAKCSYCEVLYMQSVLIINYFIEPVYLASYGGGKDYGNRFEPPGSGV